MTRYTHPDFEGIFPQPKGQFVTIDGRQIGSAFFRTSTPQEIEALGFVEYVAPEPEPPTLEGRKAQTVAAAYARCQAAITGGFVSDALGDPHTYPSAITDQINLMGSVTESLLPNLPIEWTTAFWCADTDDVWLMRDHDATQIQKAGQDGKRHVLACQMHLDALIVAIGAVQDDEAMDAIDIEAGWP